MTIIPILQFLFKIKETSYSFILWNSTEFRSYQSIQNEFVYKNGVGLEINEPPVLSSRSNDILQECMVIAVEPKFVLPSIGSVGIENTYIINNQGIEKVTLCEESMLTL